MDEYISILLFSEDLAATPSNLPLLTQTQTVLNEAYKKTYCARHEIFGDDHVRLADPAQFVDITKEDGFMVVVLRLEPTSADATGPRTAEVVATGSVKNFGDNDISSYAEWSENVGGAEWKAKRDAAAQKGSATEETATTGNGLKEWPAISKYELVAFAVSPRVQAKGLGVRVLSDIEWLVSMYRPGSGLRHLIDPADASVTGIEMEGSTLVPGYDVRKLRDTASRIEMDDAMTPLLVLVAVRELGTETYYEKRGFKTAWTGAVPVANMEQFMNSNEKLLKIGAGFCGTVWADERDADSVRATLALKCGDGAPERSISHEYEMHNHVLSAWQRYRVQHHNTDRTLELRFNVPSSIAFLQPDSAEWPSLLSRLPSNCRVCEAIVNDRIMPMPHRVRELLG